MSSSCSRTTAYIATLYLPSLSLRMSKKKVKGAEIYRAERQQKNWGGVSENKEDKPSTLCWSITESRNLFKNQNIKFTYPDLIQYNKRSDKIK
jgi:hypothetical protein